MDKVLAPRELSWKTHGCKKGKMNSTAMGKTLSPGRELLKRVPFNERTWGVLSDREPGSQSRPVFFWFGFVLFFYNVILEPWRPKQARRGSQRSQPEGGRGDSSNEILTWENFRAWELLVRGSVGGSGQLGGGGVGRFPPRIEGWSQTVWVQIPAPPATGWPWAGDLTPGLWFPAVKWGW